MIKRILLLFCYAGLVIQTSISSDQKPVRFSVLTWNVLGLEAAKESNAFKVLPNQKDRILTLDGTFKLSTKNGLVNYPTVLAVLQSFNADILCLQEVSIACMDDITNILTIQGYRLAHWQAKGSRAGTCIYYKKDKFKCCSKIIALDLPLSAPLIMSSTSSFPSSMVVPSPDSLEELSGSFVASPSKYAKKIDGHDSPELLAVMKSAGVDAGTTETPATVAALVSGSPSGTVAATTTGSPAAFAGSFSSSSPMKSASTVGSGMCVAIYLKTIENDSELLVCSVHLVRPKGKNVASIMAKEMEPVINLVNNCSCPVVIAGDFNVYPVPFFEQLLPKSLHAGLLISRHEDRFYTDKFNVLFSGELTETNKMSDYILSRHVLYHSDLSCSGEQFCLDLGNFGCKNVCQKSFKYERFPSDHVPLFAQFEIDISSDINALIYYLKSLMFLDKDKLEDKINSIDKDILSNLAIKYSKLRQWIPGVLKDIGDNFFLKYQRSIKDMVPV